MWFADDETLKGLDKDLGLREGNTYKLLVLWTLGVSLTTILSNELPEGSGISFLFNLISILAEIYIYVIFIRISFNTEYLVDLFSGRYLVQCWNFLVTVLLTGLITIFGLILLI